MLQTKRAFVITLIAVVAVIAASTMIAKPVYAPTCETCAKSFAPGQLAIINSLPASIYAPGQQAYPPNPANGHSDSAPGQEVKSPGT